MGQTLVRDAQRQAHLPGEHAVLLDEHPVEGADEHHHTQGVHGDHGKCDQPHQIQGRLEGAGDEEDDRHLGHLRRCGDEKDAGSVQAALLEAFGKCGADKSFHKGGHRAADGGEAADVKEVTVHASDDSRAHAGVGASQKSGGQHADDTGVDDCALGPHPGVGGHDADRAED